MNRFVSLLPVALCLAAVSPAQPAKAQSQWVQGQLYYDKNNIAYLDDYGCTTITTKPLGNLTLKSDATANGGYYDAYGIANGGLIHQDYLWVGEPNSPGTSFTYTDNSMIYGKVSDGDGTASSYVDNLQGSAGYKQSYSMTSSTGAQSWSDPNNTSTTVTRTHSFGAKTADAYAGFAIANATVTFGPPS